MALPPRRSTQLASRGSHSVASGRAGAPGHRPSGLKVLLAGVDSDTRGLVEAAVRHALGSRAVSEKWTVSLVRIGDKWSVTLDGPEPQFRNLSFTASQDRLSSAIREAIGAPAAGAKTAAGATGVASGAPPAVTTMGDEVRVRQACESCGQPFTVVYEQRPGETKVVASVACPHCWQINHAEIGDWAAAGRDYRAEKA
jgi:hypothetical protein